MTLLIGNADNFADSGYVLAGSMMPDLTKSFLPSVSPLRLSSDTYITSLKQLLLQLAASLCFVLRLKRLALQSDKVSRILCNACLSW